MTDTPPAAYYVTSLDRLGLAVLAGGTLSGALAAMLALAGGERSPLTLAGVLVLGTLAAVSAVVALASRR